MSLGTPIFRHDQPEAPARQISGDMRGFISGLSGNSNGRDFQFEEDDSVGLSVDRAAQRVGSVLDSLMAQGLEESQLSAFVRKHYAALGLSVDAFQDSSVLNSFVEVVLELRRSDLERKKRLHHPGSKSAKAIDSQLSWLITYAPEATVFLARGLYRRWLLNAAAIVRELETRNGHSTFSEAIRTLRMRAATVMAQAQTYDQANDVDFMEDPATSAEDSLIGSLAVLLGERESTSDEPAPVAVEGRGDSNQSVAEA